MRARLLVLTLLLVTNVGSPVAAGAAGASCHGEAATLVGKPGQGTLRGTPGRDVIVTRGVFEIHAGEGDDLICVTDGADGSSTGNVGAGSGDDEVWVDTSDGPWVELGVGADTFHGGPGSDTVWAGVASADERDGPEDARDAESDVISTGGSSDMVILGEQAAPLADRVDTGPGADEILLQATAMTPEARLDLGAGYDTIWFYWPKEQMGDWLLDNRVGAGTLDGVHRLQWSSAESFDLPEPGANAVSFVGRDVAESVWASSFADIDLGGGDDYFSQGFSFTSDASSRVGALHGGAGRDSYDLEAASHASVDLASGQVRFAADDSGFVPVDLDGFRDVRVAGGWDAVRIRGDAQDNRIEVTGCVATVHAGAGDDRVIASEVSRCRRSSRAVLYGEDGSDVLVGGAAADRLVGGRGPDRIVGGPGRDRADGGPGVDTCAVEVRHSCRAPAPRA